MFSWQSADRLIDAVRALRADLSLPDVQRLIAAAARTLVDAGEAAFVPAWSASRAVGDGGVAGTATRIDVPVVAHDRMHGVLRLRARTAATFGPADQALLAVFAAAAGSAIAVTGLLHEARRCERSGNVLLEVANALLAGDEPDTVLPLIAAHAAGIVAADTAAIALPGWPATGLRIVTAVGHGADELTGMQLPRAGTIVGDVLRDGATALIEAGCLDERMFLPAATAMTAGPVLVVPLRSGPEIAGVLLASRRAGKPRPAAAACAELDSFAAQAGGVLEHSRQQRQRRQLAISENQARIAGGLHDSVISQLSATCLTLQGAAQLTGSRELADRIQRVVGDLDDAIHRIRLTIFGLGVRPTAAGGLPADVLAMTERLAETYAFACHVDLDGLAGHGLSPEAAGHLLAVLRDALTNVGRHARATRVDVSLRTRASEVVLRLAADGTGQPWPDEQRDVLKEAEHRAHSLGGGLSVGSGPEPAGGTSIEWWVPLRTTMA
jgi:signal transduction histidine kinase